MGVNEWYGHAVKSLLSCTQFYKSSQTVRILKLRLSSWFLVSVKEGLNSIDTSSKIILFSEVSGHIRITFSGVVRIGERCREGLVGPDGKNTVLPSRMGCLRSKKVPESGVNLLKSDLFHF